METQLLAQTDKAAMKAVTDSLGVGAIVPSNFQDAYAMAKVLFQSRLFPDLQDASQAVVKIMAGAEMGLPAIASLNAFHIVKGKVMTHYTAIAGAIRRAGYDYRTLEHTDEVCEIEFLGRDGDSIGVSRFSQADAKRQGTQNMEKMPRVMLFARAMSQGARFYVPEAFNGLIVYETSERHLIEEESPDVPESARPGTSDYVASKVVDASVDDDFNPFVGDDTPNENAEAIAALETEAHEHIVECGLTPSQMKKVKSHPEWVALVLKAKGEGVSGSSELQAVFA